MSNLKVEVEGKAKDIEELEGKNSELHESITTLERTIAGSSVDGVTVSSLKLDIEEKV